MLVQWLSFLLSAACFAASHAQVTMGVPNQEANGLSGLPAGFGLNGGVQADQRMMHQPVHGMFRYTKRSIARRPLLLVVAITAALAVTFVILQCFEAIQSRSNRTLRRRRLAEGEEDDTENCQNKGGQPKGPSPFQSALALVTGILPPHNPDTKPKDEKPKEKDEEPESKPQQPSLGATLSALTTGIQTGGKHKKHHKKEDKKDE